MLGKVCQGKIIVKSKEVIDIAETGGTPDRSPKSCIAAIEKILKTA